MYIHCSFSKIKKQQYDRISTVVKELRRFTDKINKSAIPIPLKWTKMEIEQVLF